MNSLPLTPQPNQPAQPSETQPTFLWPLTTRDWSLKAGIYDGPSPDRIIEKYKGSLLPVAEVVSRWSPTNEPVLDLQVARARLIALRDSKPLSANTLDAAQEACGHKFEDLREAIAVLALHRVSKGSPESRNTASLNTPGEGFHARLDVEGRLDCSLPSHPKDIASLHFALHAGIPGGHSYLTLLFAPEITVLGHTKDRYAEHLKGRPALTSEKDGAQALWTGLRILAANLLETRAVSAQEVVPYTPSSVEKLVTLAAHVGYSTLRMAGFGVAVTVFGALALGEVLATKLNGLYRKLSGAQESPIEECPKADAQLLTDYARALLTEAKVNYASGLLPKAGTQSSSLRVHYPTDEGRTLQEFSISPTKEGQFEVTIGSKDRRSIYSKDQLDSLVAGQREHPKTALMEDLSYEPISRKIAAFEQALNASSDKLPAQERAHLLEYHGGTLAKAFYAVASAACRHDPALVRGLITRLYAGSSRAEYIYETAKSVAQRPQINPALRERLDALQTMSPMYVADFWNRSIAQVNKNPAQQTALVYELFLAAKELNSPALKAMGDLT